MLEREAAGRTIAGYFVLKRIGFGGFGAVYRVQAADGTEMAMKIVTRPDDAVASHHRIERFIREIRALAALHHPCIIPIIATGTHEDAFWYTMPVSPHGTLVDRIMLPDDPALHEPAWHSLVCHYVHQVLLGLAAAHTIPLIHRDISPDNILIHPEHPNRIYIMDWGMAYLESDRQLTQDGAVMGKPGYIAPEQASFRDPDPETRTSIDGRIDLYATGTVLFELLTGVLPFQGKSGANNSMSQVFRKVEYDPPDIRDSNPFIPSPLARIVARMLARHPDQRYCTCAVAADALAPFTH